MSEAATQKEEMLRLKYLMLEQLSWNRFQERQPWAFIYFHTWSGLCVGTNVCFYMFDTVVFRMHDHLQVLLEILTNAAIVCKCVNYFELPWDRYM